MQALLENAKEIALQHRREQELAVASCDRAMEEDGESYAMALAVLDEEAETQEMAECEAALRLSLRLDEEDDLQIEQQEQLDAEIARKVGIVEAEAAAVDERLKGKLEAADERVATKMAARMRAEANRIAKLEERQKKLAEKKLVSADIAQARALQKEIEQEEMELLQQECADTMLARSMSSKIRADERKALAKEAADAKLARKLARGQEGGAASLPLRTMLRCKLGALRVDLTNRLAATSS